MRVTRRTRFAVAALLACGACAHVRENPGGTIRIGALYNRAGSQASLGIPSLQGAQLAVEEINARGGVLGRRLELIAPEGASDTAALRVAAERLVRVDGVTAVFGLNDTDLVLAAAPPVLAAGRAFVTSGATSPRLPGQVPGPLYLACFGDNTQAAAGAEFAFDTLRARKAALLYDAGMDYTVLLGRYFGARFTELGGRVTVSLSYASGAADLAAVIARLNAQQDAPDLLYVAAGPDEVGGIVAQLRAAGFAQPVMGGDAYDTPLLVQQAGPSADGVYFTTHALFDAETPTPRAAAFVAAYRARYGRAPESAFAGLGYDAARLMADVITRAGSDDPAAFDRALQQTRGFAGVTGTISYDAGSHLPRKSVTVVRIAGGRRTQAAEITPRAVPAP
ncbi:MAG TPA: ABC transporter substrate-binding protein [Longimicrobium sp.]|jgi:branched-chain amino acid transport system substrate-binding protein|uniref:ABC transporter substrate-binding protein n=1 Tax=Longimicrobium sp. TaxID=2029185 RepID=UPI002EDAC8B1